MTPIPSANLDISNTGDPVALPAAPVSLFVAVLLFFMEFPRVGSMLRTFHPEVLFFCFAEASWRSARPAASDHLTQSMHLMFQPRTGRSKQESVDTGPIQERLCHVFQGPFVVVMSSGAAEPRVRVRALPPLPTRATWV